jgi:hypothetical protein
VVPRKSAESGQSTIVILARRWWLAAGPRVDPVAQRVIYADETGQRHELRLQPMHFGDRGCVGIRKLDQAPWTVEFPLAHVRFVFDTYEDAYELLLNPLGRLGQDTLEVT